MSLWKVAGALLRPNGIRFNCYMPFPGTVNAVMSLEFSSNGIYKYADVKSTFEVNLTDRKVSKILLIDKIGYKSFLVILFTFLKSRQNLHSPFGFLIMIIGFDQSEQ